MHLFINLYRSSISFLSSSSLLGPLGEDSKSLLEIPDKSTNNSTQPKIPPLKIPNADISNSTASSGVRDGSQQQMTVLSSTSTNLSDSRDIPLTAASLHQHNTKNGKDILKNHSSISSQAQLSESPAKDYSPRIGHSNQSIKSETHVATRTASIEEKRKAIFDVELESLGQQDSLQEVSKNNFS